MNSLLNHGALKDVYYERGKGSMYIIKFTITQHTTAFKGAIINHPEISQVGVYDFVDVSCLVWPHSVCVCVADFGILVLSLGVDETIQPDVLIPVLISALFKSRKS